MQQWHIQLLVLCIPPAQEIFLYSPVLMENCTGGERDLSFGLCGGARASRQCQYKNNSAISLHALLAMKATIVLCHLWRKMQVHEPEGGDITSDITL